MPELIEESMVVLDLAADDKDAAVRVLAERLAAAGRVTDVEQFLADVRAREQVMATGLEGGIGIPHARSIAVTAASLAFGRSPARVDFGASDGPADLIFLIAAPAEGGAEHMTILASLARRLVHGSFRESLRSLSGAAEVAALINREVGA
ncbi:MAG: fructose PTS transporter subunit IIA [Actinomycetota bacterium]|nr:fructose PTS transporter subunit IIA [Actinomycetota bacterium]MDA8208305.1 fructose PTS transporter subunit IIA [Actinomycetota bacterium]